MARLLEPGRAPMRSPNNEGDNVMTIRRIIAITAVMLIGLFGAANHSADAAPDTVELAATPDGTAKVAHDTATAYNVCKWFDTVFYGPEINNALRIGWHSFHYYNLHYVRCCYDISPYGYNAYGIYSIDYGTWDWLPGDAWCPNS